MSPTCWLTTGSFKSLTMLVFYEIAGEKKEQIGLDTVPESESLVLFFPRAIRHDTTQ